MIFAEGTPVEASKCQTCGNDFVEKCESCGAELGNTFVAPLSYLTRKPEPMPRRPEFCRGCGAAFPWKQDHHENIESTGIWTLLHPKVVNLAKSRFSAGHYADAVESVFKELNTQVKKLYRDATSEELDGVSLMRKAFSPAKPVIVLDDLTTETGRNIQQGYLDIFAGSMAAIRNPKAHENIQITAERALHHLMLASLLFYRLGERKLSSNLAVDGPKNPGGRSGIKGV